MAAVSFVGQRTSRTSPSGEPLPNSFVRKTNDRTLAAFTSRKGPRPTPLTGLFIQTLAVIERRAQILHRSRSVVRVARNDPSNNVSCAQSADVERRPLVRLAMSAARCLGTNIAMQRHNSRCRSNTALWQSVSQFASTGRSGTARASLSNRMCYHFLVCALPDQVRLSNVLKIISVAAVRLHRE